MVRDTNKNINRGGNKQQQENNALHNQSNSVLAKIKSPPSKGIKMS